MNLAGFQANYLDLVLSFLSVILSVVAGIFGVKHRRLTNEYDAVVEDRGRLKDNFKKLTEDRDRLAGLLRQATEARDRYAGLFGAADAEENVLILVGQSVAEVLQTHRHGAVLTNAIRAVAKRRGVLPAFEALLSGASKPRTSTS